MNPDEPEHNFPTAWHDKLQAFAIRVLGVQTARLLWQKYQPLLSADYQSLISPRYALNDILQLERLISTKQQAISLLKPYPHYPHYRLHFYSQQARYLDEFIPVLENMGLRVMDQVQFSFNVDGVSVSLKSFTIKSAHLPSHPLNLIKNHLLTAIERVMQGQVENDALNKLCVLAGLNWQACDLLRAYRNYYLQLGYRTTRASVHHALLNNPDVALALYQYFDARFKPDPDWQDPVFREEQVLFPLRLRILDNLASVADINDDRILRTLFNLIDATVRCNFHQRCTADDYFIAFKINSLGVIDMPTPKPYCEIYVHAIDMEGIHLRGGKIARGGIRWSDRLDDFRTEILDLMQTQINKNALIIPTGAKGGFVVKDNTSRQDFKAAGKKAYSRLIRGMLDLTDNFIDNNHINPKDLVIYDDPDPYLVVAADKGTAQFSDSANAIAAEYGFWLGDAFASGGSYGYDHKALGITARGAWVCIQRHFRELGKDIQRHPFTVIGIGSMDGDVFGNGMLLSPCIRLLAAFSGQHIFIDPTPPQSDAAFKERQRLFELAGSNWDDYDRSLISKGGGVYLRSAKDIPVSDELKRWLGIRYKSIDGEALIRALLVTPVELLWLGGIGTYVKASTEKHEEVGDRGNDTVRVNASELGATVVGEGANLGFTQQARIEYSLRGGRINTDAVDNSAGVDTSDHEVNLKILLNSLQKKQRVADYHTLFTDMTDAVCQLVLADNVAQSLCLSLEQLRCAENPALFLQLAEHLEAAGVLDRAVQCFASNKDILTRPGQVISRPELADLMAASKMYLAQQLQDQADLLQDDCYERYCQAYFPVQLRTGFKAYLSGHALATEIKATVISNLIINQAGCGFLGLIFDTDGNIITAIDCYLAFDQILQADALRQAIAELDNQIPAAQQYQLLNQLEHRLISFCRWALLHGREIRPDASTINVYSAYLNAYKTYINQHRSEQEQAQHQHPLAQLPAALAQKWGVIDAIHNFPYWVSLTEETQQDFTLILALLDEVTHRLAVNDIQQQIAAIALRDNWESLVVHDLQEDMQHYIGQIVKKILASSLKTCGDYFTLPEVQQRLTSYQQVYLDIQQTAPRVLLPYVVLVRAMAHVLGKK
ncbi:NAD-glutamate dehydrogenase domain-containing protein [Crenothrix polyspora]|uniref:NAD-specific glutamate dehydrogenase GdhB n=1 Tax=Crenothrix polyspora TaxID=360316 RepID=A0A1R4HCY0_9GAMM|nr:NAD-glutamate dehydrogenase domain-containing protein [Crenothrix polyspora]SJM94105.1 NAD-specific glutamate dehydrogenase GdhB [Crenothrix polyspora]